MEHIGFARGIMPDAPTVRRWLNRAFVLSILAYLVVVGYLVAEAVMGASKWAPYGVNVPVFIALVVGSEIIVAATGVWIFREDAGIWPDAIAKGWQAVRRGNVLSGVRQIAIGAWDLPILDLRLRTTKAIALGRINRIAALVPLCYALIASAGGAPLGLRGSALFDIVITMVVWGFMEVIMVRPEAAAATEKRSYYETRRVRDSDLDRILEIEQIKWKEQAVTAEQFYSRLAAFPQGQIACVHVTEMDGQRVREKVVAWSTISVLRDQQIGDVRSWDEVTANGTIANADPDGDVIVGVNLTSVTEGATVTMFGEILASLVEWNKNRMIGGSRMNGYVSFNERRRAEGKRMFSAEEYVMLREIRGYRLNEERAENGLAPLPDGEYFQHVQAIRAERGEVQLPDDEAADYVCSNVRGYMAVPGAHILRAVPEYYEDPASANYGVLMGLANPLPRPLRLLPFARSWLANRIRREAGRDLEQRRARIRASFERRRATERVPAFLQADGGRPAEPIGAADAVEVGAVDAGSVKPD
ncbi:MAG: hypothetical protein WEB04_10525 [Dehalococcoidia bacterium]